MSILSKVFGNAGSVVTQPIEAVGNIVDELFTSKEEKLTAEQVKLALLQKPQIAQIEINKIEASHRSIFVSGWRPFIGWICGSSLGYNYILRDLLNYIVVIKYPEFELLPALQMEHLMTVLGGLLGIGTLRTIEKLNNKTK
jgi:hypothetical protein